MDYEPISVALRFGFIALLFLFLIWIARSSRSDLRRLTVPAPDATGLHSAGLREPDRVAVEGWLVVAMGGGLEAGSRYDLFGGVSIGRSSEADIPIDDRYASGIPARVFESGGRFYVEDMQSTNGTVLNGEPVDGEAALIDGDRIGIGDAEFVFEGG